MKKLVLYLIAAAAVVALMTTVVAQWVGVAGYVVGVVVPKTSPELEKKGFQVEGFYIDLGKIAAGETKEVKGVFKVIAPYNTELTISVSTEGPIKTWKITLYDSSGYYIASLNPYYPKTTIKVSEGTNEFTAYITITTAETQTPQKFTLTINLSE